MTGAAGCPAAEFTPFVPTVGDDGAEGGELCWCKAPSTIKATVQDVKRDNLPDPVLVP